VLGMGYSYSHLRKSFYSYYVDAKRKTCRVFLICNHRIKSACGDEIWRWYGEFIERELSKWKVIPQPEYRIAEYPQHISVNQQNLFHFFSKAFCAKCQNIRLYFHYIVDILYSMRYNDTILIITLCNHFLFDQTNF
jgi:hypothetical protein